MSDLANTASLLTSLLQTAASAAVAAARVAAIQQRMLADGRNKLTPEEWNEVDAVVERHRAAAITATSG